MTKGMMKCRVRTGILSCLLAVQAAALGGCGSVPDTGVEISGEPIRDQEAQTEPETEEALPAVTLQEDTEKLAAGSYEMVYLAQWSLETVRAEDMETYYRCDYFLSGREIENLEEMEEYLEAVSSGLPSLKFLFLGFRPDLLDVGELLASEAYLRVLDAHPETRMILIPAYPSVDYWKGLSEEQCQEVLSAYEEALNTISAAEKESYFFGSSPWLVTNPDLYEKEFCVREDLSYTMMGLMEETYRYQIKPWNGQGLADELRELVTLYRNGGVTYPDLSGRKIVIFGDSIFGNFRGDTGMARILARQTGAEVYNLAIGGASCADTGEDSYSFGRELACFLDEEPTDLQLPEDAVADYRAAREEVTAGDGENVLFLIEFGINDFIGGQPVGSRDSGDGKTTLGALRSGIESLRAEYPQARILVLAPGLVSILGNGTEAQSEAGSELAAYRDGIREVAASMGVTCIDLSAESGVNETTFTYYVSDGVHYNERGRFLLAGKVGEWIAGAD